MLCILAVFGAQVFGVVRGFVCDCGGVVEFVEISSCQGPHGAECHTDGAPQTHGSQEEHNDSDSKHHEQVGGELQAATSTAKAITAPTPHLLAILAEAFLFAPEPVSPLKYRTDAGNRPPLSIAVARTVVLRI